MCLEFVPAGVSCICHYDDMWPIGPDNLTHTHTHTHIYLNNPGCPRQGGALGRRTRGRGVGEGQSKVRTTSEIHVVGCISVLSEMFVLLVVLCIRCTNV